MSTLDLSQGESKLLSGILLEHADCLYRYVAWINDRPMLPARESAVAQIEMQYRATMDLLVRLLATTTSPNTGAGQ